MKKAIIGIIIAVIIIGGGYWGWLSYQHNQVTQTTPTPTPSTSPTPIIHQVSYQGQDGKTALELLQSKYPDTVTAGQGANAYVTAINGYTANDSKSEFWKFMINGQDAQVGAGSYITKSTDQITWTIDTY